MIDLSEHRDGLILPVHAQPGASRNGVRGQQAGRLKVAVTQVAEKGKANIAILATLAKALKLKKSQLALRSGETQAQKEFLVSGISQEELALRLQICLQNA